MTHWMTGVLAACALALSDASDLLEQAEKAAAKGQYKKATQLYDRLAKSFPQAPEGRIGARRAQDNAFLGRVFVVENGPAENRVDIVILGEGFRLDQQGDFDTLAKMVPREFPRVEVFEEYQQYLNFIRANLVSKDDGVDGNGRDYSTVLGAASAGGIQGQVTVDRRAVMNMLSEVPENDGLAIVLVKNGNLGTGGHGVATVGGRDPKTCIHEFGHAFAGLMDEYSSNTGHRVDIADGPNVAFTDDEKRVPWAHWLEKRVSGVGVYQGAHGRPQGAWKPTTNCIMDVGQQYCPVCREAIVLRIHSFVDPIEDTEPKARDSAADPLLPPGGDRLIDMEPISFTVRTMQPKSHSLIARWWVLKDEEAPKASALPAESKSRPERTRRGPLAAIAAKPVKESKAVGGRDTFAFEPRDFGEGTWRVIVRVEDTTRVKNETWVLKDERGVLQSERQWWVQVGASGQ